MQKLTLILTLFLCVGVSRAQLNEPDKPLKVGLVLSGGGAKGMAHIGALKVIEESGITIDYIGGTSMGFRKIKKYFEAKILFKIEETDTIILQAKATLSSQYKEKVITMLKKENT
jgi:hypothetical protein